MIMDGAVLIDLYNLSFHGSSKFVSLIALVAIITVIPI